MMATPCGEAFKVPSLAGLSISGKRLTYEELTHGHLTLYGNPETPEQKTPEAEA